MKWEAVGNESRLFLDCCPDDEHASIDLLNYEVCIWMECYDPTYSFLSKWDFATRYITVEYPTTYTVADIKRDVEKVFINELG